MSYKIPLNRSDPNWPLPSDYHTFGPDAKKQARRALLESWWDPAKPDVLITQPYNYRVAFQFFVETYVKRDPEMRKVFAKPDCRWVPDWMRQMTHPSSATVGFRGSSKTVWWVHLAPEFVALTRPGTPICVSEFNADRTHDEMTTIQGQFETNQLYAQEFGTIKPTKFGRRRWSGRRLDLANGSYIRGISVKSAHRGRHPLLFVMDDAEKDQESEKEEWREYFMETFYKKVVLGMMRPGSFLWWTGTFLHPAACLVTAVRKTDKDFQRYDTMDCPLIVREISCHNCGHHDLAAFDSDLIEQCPKCRFELEYKELTRDSAKIFGPGAMSMWPEYWSVSDAVAMIEKGGTEDQRVRGMGARVFWTEMMNRPELGGDRMFKRESTKHGYRIIEAGDGSEVLQLLRNPIVRLSTADWLSGLHITGGVDVADSVAKTADFSAIVVLGFDWQGLCFLLDAWHGRVRYYDLIKRAHDMWKLWNIARLAWDETALGSVISHQVSMLLDELQAEGSQIPAFVPINLAKDHLSKMRRISRLEVPMIQGRCLFPELGDFDHLPAMHHRHARSVASLIQQFDRYTARGAGTAHDDLIDAYEMAFYVNGGFKPEKAECVNETQKVIDEFAKVGIHVDRHMLPEGMWTKRMWQEARGVKLKERQPGRRPRIWT